MYFQHGKEYQQGGEWLDDELHSSPRGPTNSRMRLLRVVQGADDHIEEMVFRTTTSALCTCGRTVEINQATLDGVPMQQLKVRNSSQSSSLYIPDLIPENSLIFEQ